MEQEREGGSPQLSREDLPEKVASVEGSGYFSLRIYTSVHMRPLFPDCSQSMLGKLRVQEQSPSGPNPNSSNRQVCLGDTQEPWGSRSCPAGWAFPTPDSFPLLCFLKVRPALWADPFVKDTPHAISPKKSFVFLPLSRGVLCRGAEHREKTWKATRKGSEPWSNN